MTNNMFIDQLKNFSPYNQLLEEIQKRTSPISLHGLSEETLAHISYSLNQHVNKQVLIITYDDLKAKNLYEDLRMFSKGIVGLFPAREIVFYDIEAFSHEISNQRLQTLDRLATGENIIVVTSINAILNKVMNSKLWKSNSFNIEYGQNIELRAIAEDFISIGYERVNIIEGKGQFSIRGGIVDFFPTISEQPYRIELFDDEIDSIRTFDLKTQRSIENISMAHVPPAKEIIIFEDMRDDIIKNLQQDLNQSVRRLKKNLSEHIDKLMEKYENQIQSLNNNMSINNIDMIIPYMSEGIGSIIDYFEKEFIVLVDEPQRIEESYKASRDEFLLKYTDLFEKGEVLAKHQDIYAGYDELVDKITENICITSTGLLKNNPRFKPMSIISFTTKGMQPFHNKLELLVEELKHYKYRGYKTIILSGTDDRGKRLTQSLKEKGIECNFVEDSNKEIKSSQVFITPGTISKGFEYPNIKFAIISDKEVFGIFKRKKAVKTRKDAAKIAVFTDLKVGDYVVHESHGIGKYTGIEQLKVEGVVKDYLSIQYSGEDKLYVPVDQMNLVQKYIGSDSIKPKINKLSSNEWTKAKTKVKKAIEDMAKDLLKLYAERQTVKGYSFSKDQPWQHQFEDLFPYEETDDQLRCIEEIKKDMEADKPMDRLLCGDVGYGKTEVALRAAFKAVMEGKQVAILVPTTILAQQHYNTIVERFGSFPIKVDMLSRFRTPGQQSKIINDLKSGNLDIVVGTHRLLSKDVKFYDLGLLVVDEEQRFGVKHKENIKTLKKSVDVLTLTATPIPRTLHMSLIGIRDMSVLEEPPEERYPIQTYVVEYNEQLIRDAIVKELNRNGQIYFVYNRVQGIQKIATRLKQLVPEARIAIGHGQMSERELERIMIDFLRGEYDVLVSTTIIETGLDIPNVNTIIISDSDKMGLSQLYQLRGRVGRSNRLAFAYFTYERDKVLSEIAEKRLKAIKEFTEFGSGFKIAMRDLEIRGAGNLLGSEQHGHMEAIGYDLYVKFLEEAVKKLKGETKDIEFETTIELNVSGFISEKYINDEEQKIEIYKRISVIESSKDQSDVIEELIDRFGDIPGEVSNLIRISYIKSLCKKTNIVSITQKGLEIKLDFANSDNITPQLVNDLLLTFGRRINFDLSRKPNFTYRIDNQTHEAILTEVEKLVEKISSFHNN